MLVGHVVHTDLVWPALNGTTGLHQHRVCSSKHNTALFLSSHPWKSCFSATLLFISSAALTPFRQRSFCSPTPPLSPAWCVMLWKPCTVSGWTTTWTSPIDLPTNMLWLPCMWTCSKTSPAHGQLVWCWLCQAAQGGILLCWAATWWPSPWPNLFMSVSQP